MKTVIERTAVVRTNFYQNQVRFDERDRLVIDISLVETNLPQHLRDMLKEYDFEREDVERILDYVWRTQMDRAVLRGIRYE